ncbi:MAG: GNAT family N-acyltransferase [Desulfobacterales bacterium]|nr:GNAT family N-acyltransferase [Desulfobacterales bacterium]
MSYRKTEAKKSLDPLISTDENDPNFLKRKLFSMANQSLESLLAIDKIREIYDDLPPCETPFDFIDKSLRVLNIEHSIRKDDLKAIPPSGPAIVVANHPFGGIDGLLLASVLGAVRRDIKVLANYFLGAFTELRPLFILADPFGSSSAVNANKKALRECIHWVKAGGILVVFPAGEVSQLRLKRRKIEDPDWEPTLSRLVRITQAPVMPVYFDGRNSLSFQLAGLIHPRLRTAMLPRELLKKKTARIQLRLGSLIPFKRLATIGNDADLTAYLRFRTYLLGNAFSKTPVFFNTPEIHRLRRKSQKPIVPAHDTAAITNEIGQLPQSRLLATSGEFAVCLADANRIPLTLMEIGRLREITFRQVGEGTGKSIDLDRFDEHCKHLLVWNSARRHIVGAYRLGLTDEIVRKYGKEGLYTYTLFRYQNHLLRQLGPALELSRSFVRQEYQKNFAPLMLLWKGIGEFIAAHPRYKILFGAVSITNDYNSYSRKLMAAFLEANNSLSDMSRMVRARKPYRQKTIRDLDRVNTESWPRDIEELSAWISGIETDGKGVPILIKQYLKLGGKLLSFNIDSSFGNVLDGLIMVDLTRTDPKILKRYMGSEGFAAFIDYHLESYQEHPISGELSVNPYANPA